MPLDTGARCIEASATGSLLPGSGYVTAVNVGGASNATVELRDGDGGRLLARLYAGAGGSEALPVSPPALYTTGVWVQSLTGSAAVYYTPVAES